MAAAKNVQFKLIGMYDGRARADSASPVAVVEKAGTVMLLLENKADRGKAKISTSDDGFNFQFTAGFTSLEENPDFPNAVVVHTPQSPRHRVMYYGDRSIRIANKKGAQEWQAKDTPIILSPKPLMLVNVFTRDEGYLILYYEKTIENEQLYYEAHLALCDKEHPEVVIWRTQDPLFRSKDLWHEGVRSVGAVIVKDQLITYWYVDGITYGVVYVGFLYDPSRILRKKVSLKRHTDNPIIAPHPDHPWEAFNTFNPAALSAGGRVHILYRAQGYDYISTVGYASSRDGITIDERLAEPIYTPRMDFENNTDGLVNDAFISGGGFGGCEDPRVTQLDDRVYMTYVAFSGWDPPRLALTSILLTDFLAKRWHWSKPVLISPPGVVDKSGCLLPEKIDGKYVFFHRVYPNILIDYVDDLSFDGKTKWLTGKHEIAVRPGKWDSLKIGAGAPPIKTPDGWLLIYYGVDEKSANAYHIGAMLLDPKHPENVLYRSDSPILSPKEEYEKNGFKPCIVYPCGAIVAGDELLVYYGGADSVVCVARANLATFLQDLKSQKPMHLTPVDIREVIV